MCNSRNTEVYELLKEVFKKDTNPLVKSYAILSFVDIACNVSIIRDEALKFLKDSIKNEFDSEVKIPMLRGLYLLGEKDFLDDLIEELKGEIYQNRCAVINMLEEIIDENNKEIIKSALTELKMSETSKAVLSSIERVL